MTEVNTFSAAVDDVIRRSGRPDKLSDILSYVRSSIRECQVLAFFRNDMIEDTLTSDTSSSYIWTHPQEYRLLRTCRYRGLFNRRGEVIYPPEIKPGKKQREYTEFYYSGPGYTVFAGVEIGSEIDVAYYTTAKKLPYFSESARPARFILEDNVWSYLTSGTDAEKLAWREQVSNWLLFTYYDTIVEGGLAKVFKTIDDPRAGSSFALYKSFQNTLLSTEPSDSLNI